MINPMNLTGKHIVITGGSSGIGRQCAVQASQLGAKVTLIARKEEQLKDTIHLMECPEKHEYLNFDLSETEKIEELVGKIVLQRGAVDGLCHAAGTSPMRMIRQTNPIFFEKTLRLHVFSFVELVRCLSIKKNLNDGASLIGISSWSAENGDISQSAYSAAKACMNGFLHPAALELASRKIRINTVAYGSVDTPMIQMAIDNGANPDMVGQKLGLIDVESAANAVIFLLSDACRYITGSVLPVYAGR